MTMKEKLAWATLIAAFVTLVYILADKYGIPVPGPSPTPSVSVSPSPEPSEEPTTTTTLPPTTSTLPPTTTTQAPATTLPPTTSTTSSTTTTRASTTTTLGAQVGVPFGAYSMLSGNASLYPHTEMFTLLSQSDAPNRLEEKLAFLRSKKLKMIFVPTGGAHENYMSVKNGVNQFDRAKWDAKLASYDTAAIKKLVADAVADGTIIGANVMDEPHVCGGENGGGNTWGPCGTMKKTGGIPNSVDSLCAAVKAVFPTLPVGVAHNYKEFEPEKSYQHCDFILTQYSYRFNSLTAWRDGALAMGSRDKIKVLFSFNPVNGGTQDKDGVKDCADQGGIVGDRGFNCAMTAEQIFESATVLGAASCSGQLFWKYDEELNAIPRLKEAYVKAAAKLKATPLACKLTRRAS